MDIEEQLADPESIECVKKHLNVYKDINRELSKKVQNLKLEKAEIQSQLVICQNNLLKEQKNHEKMKRWFNMMNSQCFQFANAYSTMVANITEEDPEVTLNLAAHDQPKMKQYSAIPIRRMSCPGDAELLGAITEESNTLQTSTPFHSRHPGFTTFGSVSSSSSNETMEHQTPKKLSGPRTRRLSQEMNEISPENFEKPTDTSENISTDQNIKEHNEMNDSEDVSAVFDNSAVENQNFSTDQENEMNESEELNDVEEERADVIEQKKYSIIADNLEESKIVDQKEDSIIGEPEKEKIPPKILKNAADLKERRENIQALKSSESNKPKIVKKSTDKENKTLKRKKTTSESSEELHNEDVSNGRAKRQRSKVTYLEPKLNVKMRQPKKK